MMDMVLPDPVCLINNGCQRGRFTASCRTGYKDKAARQGRQLRDDGWKTKLADR